MGWEGRGGIGYDSRESLGQGGGQGRAQGRGEVKGNFRGQEEAVRGEEEKEEGGDTCKIFVYQKTDSIHISFL